MSYTIDVYRGDTRAQRSIINFGTFVTLFPQLIAGPIIKYKDLGDQIDERTCSADKFASGVQMFMIGLAKSSSSPTTWACCGRPTRPWRRRV